jgi:hypothetical protein
MPRPRKLVWADLITNTAATLPASSSLDKKSPGGLGVSVARALDLPSSFRLGAWELAPAVGRYWPLLIDLSE